jgi:hypothetical protein
MFMSHEFDEGFSRGGIEWYILNAIGGKWLDQTGLVFDICLPVGKL